MGMTARGRMATHMRENIMSRTKSSRLMQAFQIPHTATDGNINSLSLLTKRHPVVQSIWEEKTYSSGWSLVFRTWDYITSLEVTHDWGLLDSGPTPLVLVLNQYKKSLVMFSGGKSRTLKFQEVLPYLHWCIRVLSTSKINVRGLRYQRSNLKQVPMTWLKKKSANYHC